MRPGSPSLPLTRWRSCCRRSVRPSTNAIYFPPGVGGVLLGSPCDQPGCSFRIDQDQKFNATTNVEYVLNRATGAWAALSWRYDSGW